MNVEGKESRPATAALVVSAPVGYASRGGLGGAVLGRIDPAIVTLTILAGGVAAYRLGTKSLWLDEAVSARYARLGLHGLWKVVSGRDPNMGLYYVLLHFWVRIFGYGETAIRSLTVVAGALTVPIIVLLGTRLFSRAAGLVAGLLLALSPFFVHYEQTARSYALVVLLVTLSSYFFVAELQRPSRATRIGYVLASVLALGAHYFAAYVLLMQLLTLLAIKRRTALTREWLTTVGAVAVLCAAEGVFALRNGTKYISWIPDPPLRWLFGLPYQLGGGRILTTALIILGCYGLLGAFAARPRWPAGFVATWCVGPVLLAFIGSKLGQPMFLGYYLIVVLPAFLLLAAAGLVRLPGRATRIVVLGLLAVFSGVGISKWYRQPSSEDYRGATRYILENEQPGDAILSSHAARVGYTYYEALAGTKAATPVWLQPGKTVPTRPPRIWLVTWGGDTSSGQSQLQRTIPPGYERVGTQPGFRDLRVILYRAQ